MRFVTIVNRTNKVLHGVWDGKHVDIAPGKHSFPEKAAIAYRRQNPLMGSLDPRTGDITYMLGIEEMRDPITPLNLDEAPPSIEKWDRSKLTGARPTEVIPGDNGLYQLGRTAGSPALSPNSGFVDPNS